MSKNLVLAILLMAGAALMWLPKGQSAANDEAEIRQLLDQWSKAFRGKDVNGVMAIYSPGKDLEAFDLVPPLRFLGSDAYKKDYQEFFAGYQGPIDVEIRDLSIVTGDTVGYSHGLERISGIMKNGQKSDMWVRFTECYRKINGRWRATHDHISVPVDFANGKALLNLQP